MDGLTWVFVALVLSLFTTLAAYFLQRFRVRRLAEQMESFLTSSVSPLSFSVRENCLAPMHNAIAELENQLLVARERCNLERQTARNLTADISHQLKTPLASLRLFCELDAGPHMREQLAQIERMEQLIQSLLVLERMCAGGYSFVFAPRNVAALVREAWQGLASVYPEKVLSLTGDAEIRCDEKWLGEAFANLLKNACEHTPSDGTVTVYMEATDTAFFCTVSDNGGGVAPRELPRLFERFYRAQSRESKGAGIGLAIVQEIIQRHHGSICARNIPGGLSMQITIPRLDLTKS